MAKQSKGWRWPADQEAELLALIARGATLTLELSNELVARMGRDRSAILNKWRKLGGARPVQRGHAGPRQEAEPTTGPRFTNKWRGFLHAPGQAAE
jgi:hypothetical protein